ncbi:hypothetical protein JY96_08395 [Aquabacterium sp. NJ1]|uniref:hypothetical protein n=1 Tax=Aquabacterium sp. NJ1 TaxID=1538295 RepID=UPI00052DD7BD|nr:hypothetical protein [Aquabacterium sp. NJ1]KGM40048.1 hypothetical protein JY96_08395 [Aquabacterium sp. NJ1]
MIDPVQMPSDAEAEEPGLPWADSLRTVLAHLDKFSAGSVVDAVMVVLRSAPADPHEALEKFPWLLVLIAKWALQGASPLRIGDRLPPEHLNELRNLLWSGGDAAHIERKVRLGKVNVMLMMRQILNCQMPYQQQDIWGLFRWSGLIDRLPKGHVCRQQYIEVMGMEPMYFVMLGITLVFAAKSGVNHVPNMAALEMLRPHCRTATERFLSMLAPSLPELRDLVRQLPRAKGTRSRELYEFSAFKRYPLFRHRDGTLVMWHPAIVDRCVDEIVHLRLAQFGDSYTEPFSKVFERYVEELAMATKLPLMTEDAYWKRYDSTDNAVDVILSCGADRLLVEAKMGLFHEDVLLQETERGVRGQTPHLLRALKQGYAVSHQLVDDPPDTRDANDGVHYLIVVTSRDLLIGTGLMLDQVCGAGRVDAPPDFSKHRLPLNRVFFLPILEYERLMEAVAKGVVDLFDVLRDATAACQDLGGSRYQFHDYYRSKVKNFPMPALISNVRTAAMEKIARAVGISLDAVGTPEDQS